MQSRSPKVLIIGLGHFGGHHFNEWLKLSAAGRVCIAGLVVESEKSYNSLSTQTNLPVYMGFDISLLADVDAVDIVTPSGTHYDLAAACLPFVDVLIEKPLAMTIEEAEALFDLSLKHNRVLMVGHIYRYHPLMSVLVEAIRDIELKPELVQVLFTNPAGAHACSDKAFFEWLHIFDLLDEISCSSVTSCSAWKSAQLVETSMVTDEGVNAVLRCGWSGTEKAREVTVIYPDCRLHADFQDGILTIKQRDHIRKRIVGSMPRALRFELEAFLETIAGRRVVTPSKEQVMSTLRLAHRATDAIKKINGFSKLKSTRPKVAVIGGGIFGATCALELAGDCDVTLFERHQDLLTEASYLNQWRHHSGFHYPRSIDTIQEVQAARPDFEERFGEAILRDVDAYFAVSNSGQEISRERYLATCDAVGLKYTIIDPPSSLVDPNKISVCLLSDESIVDIDRLREMLKAKIVTMPSVELCLGSEVISGRLLDDGSKELTTRVAGIEKPKKFDYLINASYANSNIIAGWFGFPVRPLRFDRLELAVYEIPGAPRFMMTLLDAPFTSLTSLGRGDLFILSQIHHSILESAVGEKGLPPKWAEIPMNHENLLRHGLRYLPILEKARYIESRIGVRTVSAYSEDFDGRPTVVTPHGFGCWSILGGKIITAVSNAREVKAAIMRESGAQ